MDNPSKKPLKIRIWPWIITIAIILSFLSGWVLLASWWKTQQINRQIQAKEQELAQLEQQQQAKQQKACREYQLQKDWINLTTPLANNLLVKQLFHNLCQIFVDLYAKSKVINNSYLPLYFGGFYHKTPSLGTNQGEMGNCSYDEQSNLVILNSTKYFCLTNSVMSVILLVQKVF